MAKNDKQIKDGREAEDNFIKIYQLIRKATKEEDIKEHWDVEVKVNDDIVKVDVKAVKNESRHEAFPNENFHWIEIQNVRGDDGWLYGKSDLIAFETIDYFILVGTLKLRRFLEKKLNYTKKTIKDIVTTNSKDPYSFYRRKEREDIVVKVKTIDLMHIKYLSVKKV
jgi:hypothetical protein